MYRRVVNKILNHEKYKHNTGKFFAIGNWQIEPDIICLAKSLAAGLPLSVVIAKKENTDSLPGGCIGGTYVGNPVVCRAALEVIKIIEEENLLERAVKIGNQLKKRFLEMKEKYPIIGEIRGMGAMMAIELMKDQKTEARAYLVSELKLALEDVDTLVSMGSMFLEIGDLSCATHCLLRAVDTDCASAGAYYYLGVISVLKEEFEDAAELFSHALDIRDDHVPTLRDSAYVCLEMGKLTEAAKRIKKARTLDPGDPQVKELDRRVVLARAKSRAVGFLCRCGFRNSRN